MTEELPELKFDARRTRVKQCPCGNSNRDGKFVPYKGFDDLGYCHSCGKTFLPNIEKERVAVSFPLSTKKQETSFISLNILKASLKGYENNSLVQFLIRTFGASLTTAVIGEYFIGSTKGGGTIFWQIDTARQDSLWKNHSLQCKNRKEVKGCQSRMGAFRNEITRLQP